MSIVSCRNKNIWEPFFVNFFKNHICRFYYFRRRSRDLKMIWPLIFEKWIRGKPFYALNFQISLKYGITKKFSCGSMKRWINKRLIYAKHLLMRQILCDWSINKHSLCLCFLFCNWNLALKWLITVTFVKYKYWLMIFVRDMVFFVKNLFWCKSRKV